MSTPSFAGTERKSFVQFINSRILPLLCSRLKDANAITFRFSIKFFVIFKSKNQSRLEESDNVKRKIRRKE